jgi:hypothetical protein
LNGISTDQYQVNTQGNNLPIYAVNKSINGTPMNFEITGATFNGQDYIYETPPAPGNAFSYVFQNDNQGAGSANSGFFVYFRQGSMASTNFTISAPVANEIIGINANGINNNDVWLWQLTANGNYDTLWTQVPALVGNNVIYNNIVDNIRTLYAVTSRDNDQIDLNFADGGFGDLPKGNFQLFYRQSNGQTYTITPDQFSGINITIPYANASGVVNQLTFTLSLQYTVTNSSGSETISSIQTKAPQTYYIQDRMITGEDYNIGPLTAGTDVLKIVSVNRIASGISKYFELSDVSGQYSSTDIFAHDGILYEESKVPVFQFKFQSRNQVFAALKNQLEPIVAANNFKNFYFENYPRPSFANLNIDWNLVTKNVNQTTGYFQNVYTLTPVQTGSFSNNNTAYISAGALIKFLLPNGNNVWSKVIQVIGDGANSGAGALNDGTGPVILSGKIPTNSVPIEIIPAFIEIFSYAFETQIVNLCMSQRNFGLSFDKLTRQWFIIVDSNLNSTAPFSLTYQGDVTNLQKDASWLVLFQWTGLAYNVSYRLLEYIFESANQTAFFVDYTNVNYDYTTDSVIKDQIDVLSINPLPTSTQALGADYRWQIDSAVIETDGYIEPKKVVISFYDANNDGQIDTPDSFTDIVQPDYISTVTNSLSNFVYFQILSNGDRYQIVDTTETPITAFPDDSYVNLQTAEDGELFYFYTADVIKNFATATNTLVLNNNYFAKPGRSNLKFHYMHNSGEERRIDPSKSNIIDIYMLTASYDSAYRTYLASGTGTAPLPPTSQSLENNFSSVLDPIKSISDTLVYHPANYKVLFGSNAVPNLQGTFKAVRNSSVITSDNELITEILAAINEFFSLDNWNFGQSFNFTELSTYVLNEMTPNISNFIIVPKNPSLPFGSLFEIAAQYNEILISGATATDIEIIDAITAAEINAISPIITNTNAST